MYAHKKIQDLRLWYGSLLDNLYQEVSITDYLEALALRLSEAFERDNSVVCNQINNYHPKYLGQSWKQVRNSKFDLNDAYETIAYEYGFTSFRDVPNDIINSCFERTIDLILSGQAGALREILLTHPDLVHTRSQFGHQAMLIHYLGNNGIELYRQVIPSNCIEILELLESHGADLDATMAVYGGDYTMIQLFNTSAHTYEFGIRDLFNARYKQLVGRNKN